MSFCAVFSACFKITSLPARPTSFILINKVKVNALFDTGSSVLLANGNLKHEVINHTTRRVAAPPLGCYEIPLKVGNRYMTHKILFIENLQIGCILGMDFMSRHNIINDAAKRSLRFGSRPNSLSFTNILSSPKTIHLPANSESSIKLPVSQPFSAGLVESVNSLPDQVMVMDGITASEPSTPLTCSVVIANFAHIPINIPPNTPLCSLFISNQMECKPLTECLSITESTPKVINTAHVDKICLDHLPEKWISRYRSLLRSYADVFSTNDLDVGHCTSLPHQVKLIDPNIITSINQYQLPHHLKEVAMDYVKKLLAAGFVRKSNSVFNSPLMLVKKPHADPNKPLAEQYRLVHNYVELNKNIAPCSYPLRHLYELLDEVAGGTVFSVLDLSQGFFQQHLIDPHEATSFSIPGMGQFSYCRSPRGMKSSPAYFQRLLDFVLQGIDRVYVYIDDMVVSVKSHEDN